MDKMDTLLEPNAKFGGFNLRILFRRREFSILCILILMIIILSITANGFLSLSNFLLIGRQVAVYGIMAAGMGIIMMTGNIDLSIGSTYGTAAVLTALVLVSTGNTFLALLTGLLSGVVIGFINAILIVKARLPAFIATFGMMYVTRGFALIITNGTPTTLALEQITKATHPFFFGLGGMTIAGIPIMLIEMVIIMVIMGIILHKTSFGIHVLAMGGNERAALSSGIKINKIKYISYMACGLLAAFSGIISFSFIGSVLPTAGTGMEFEVFASIIIGGTAMSGGVGSLPGIAIGVLIFGVLRNGLVLLGVTAYWQTLIIGLITIGAVAFDTLSWHRKQRGV